MNNKINYNNIPKYITALLWKLPFMGARITNTNFIKNEIQSMVDNTKKYTIISLKIYIDVFINYDFDIIYYLEHDFDKSNPMSFIDKYVRNAIINSGVLLMMNRDCIGNTDQLLILNNINNFEIIYKVSQSSKFEQFELSIFDFYTNIMESKLNIFEDRDLESFLQKNICETNELSENIENKSDKNEKITIGFKVNKNESVNKNVEKSSLIENEEGDGDLDETGLFNIFRRKYFMIKRFQDCDPNEDNSSISDFNNFTKSFFDDFKKLSENKRRLANRIEFKKINKNGGYNKNNIDLVLPLSNDNDDKNKKITIIYH